jgi:hypothetical protein
MSDLLVIVPTRGRPQNAQAFHDCWADTTDDADLLFVCDEDDPLLGTYEYRMRMMPRAGLMKVPPGLRMVGALNAAAVEMAFKYKYLGFMGDDHRCCTKQWDQTIRSAIGDRKVAVAYGNDLLQGEKIPTAVILTSNIVSELGYMAPPTMQHLCIDLVWKDWADALKCRIYLDYVVFEHMHPANGKADNDAGYQLANSSEQNKRDTDAYYMYKAGDFKRDVAKLKKLMK